MKAGRIFLCILAMPLLLLVGIYAYSSWYGVNALISRGGSFWETVTPADSRLPPWMRMALSDNPPQAQAGPLQWRQVRQGFEVAELPVLAQGQEMDRILLTRLDPARFRFELHNAPAGNRYLDDWMKMLHPAVLINASYFARDGLPDTPFLSNGVLLGPRDYNGKHGAFVASPQFTGIRDLQYEDWQTAFKGAENALVSYPLLLAADGSSRVNANRLWLANRSFIGQDFHGRILLGTTQHAFFSLERLAAFLKAAPLELTLALNLDGGPVACQGVELDGFHRNFCGDGETTVRGRELKLLQAGIGHPRWPLPLVLAAFPK